MSSVMVARICPNTTFDPAFRLLDSSLPHLSLSGLGAKRDMYSSVTTSPDQYGHPIQPVGQQQHQQQHQHQHQQQHQQHHQQQQQQQQQERPQLGRRLTYGSSSNLYQRQPALTELGGTPRQYYASPEAGRAFPAPGQGWPTSSNHRESPSSSTSRMSTPGGSMSTAAANQSQRYSADFYGSSVTSNPYLTNPPPGLTPPDLQPLQQLQQQQMLAPQLSPNLLAPEGAGGGQILASSPHRRSSGRDEFDGPHQLLAKPTDSHVEVSESELIQLPISLYSHEQDQILTEVNDRLSQCAYDFVAKYQFPIPLEPDKRAVRQPGDREWTEWCYLLKRLATKRRIPARVLYNGQIKQLVTVLENSLEMRHAAKHQSRPLKDDRNVLQLISAGLQVAKMLKDPEAMRYLDELYSKTEVLIEGRKREARRTAA